MSRLRCLPAALAASALLLPGWSGAAEVPAAASPAPYPTADRVEYVLECMKNNGGSYAFLYKCSCAIDAVAARLPYEDYIEASAVARYQTMGGERAGLFRDPEPMKRLAKRYREINDAAKQACDVPR
jgi:hypothetical protein